MKKKAERKLTRFTADEIYKGLIVDVIESKKAFRAYISIKGVSETKEFLVGATKKQTDGIMDLDHFIATYVSYILSYDNVIRTYLRNAEYAELMERYTILD